MVEVATGEKYQGEWRYDKPNGLGTLTMVGTLHLRELSGASVQRR